MLTVSLDFFISSGWANGHKLPGFQAVTSHSEHQDGSRYICAKGHAFSWFFFNVEYRVPCKEVFLAKYVKVEAV